VDKETALKLIEQARNQLPVDENSLKEAAIYLSTTYPTEYINNSYLFDNKDYGKALLETSSFNAATTDPRTILSKYKVFKDSPYANELFKKAAFAAIDKDAGIALSTFFLFRGKDYEADLLYKLATSAANNDPAAFFKNYVLFDGQNYQEPLLKVAGFNAVNKVPDSGTISRDEASVFLGIAGTDLWLRAFIDSNNLFVGKAYEKELWNKALRHPEIMLPMVRQFNALHEAPTAKRFALFNDTTAANDFDLITIGREEAYTSTYLGILNDMLGEHGTSGKLQKSGQKLTGILSPVQMERMDIFLEAAASYGRMDDVLKVIPQEQIRQIIHHVANKAGTATDLSYISTIAIMMTAPGCNADVRHLLEQEVKAQYDDAKKANNKNKMDRFGLLGATYSTNLPAGVNISTNERTFFTGMAHNPAYQQTPPFQMNRFQLTDNKGACNELMVFANDDDSKSSYNHWKTQYKDKPGWKIEEHDSFTHIYSTNNDDGRVPVHVYANHPDAHDNGLENINRAVAEQQGNATPSFQVFVGRGHSYHAPDYLKRLQEMSKNVDGTPKEHAPKLIYLGSCGGYKNITKVLQMSPDAQIISTKQTGSMDVNDPMLFFINQSINENGSVIWAQQQRLLDQLGSKNKEAYLLPNKNISLVMQRKYNSLQQEPVSERPQQNQPISPITVPRPFFNDIEYRR
jgi:hypothetical protein